MSIGGKTMMCISPPLMSSYLALGNEISDKEGRQRGSVPYYLVTENFSVLLEFLILIIFYIKETNKLIRMWILW